jgi:hypothetical protein
LESTSSLLQSDDVFFGGGGDVRQITGRANHAHGQDLKSRDGNFGASAECSR